VFDPYKLDKSGNPSLYFETLGFFGNRVKTLIKLNELVDVSRDYKFQYITWKFNG
ncbi:14353_t:CDS:2, partial [Entrophospora sp. SA101]